MPDTITFACGCGQENTVPQDRAGERTKCSRCGGEVVVPSPTAAPAARPAAWRRLALLLGLALALLAVAGWWYRDGGDFWAAADPPTVQARFRENLLRKSARWGEPD